MKKFLVISALILSFAVSAQETLLHCGKIIDTRNGKVLSTRTIVVSGSKIVRIEQGFTAPKQIDKVIDLKTKTVLPGLIDMHVHIEGETSPGRYLEKFTLNDSDVAFNAAEISHRTLMAGFTTVRDLLISAKRPSPRLR